MVFLPSSFVFEPGGDFLFGFRRGQAVDRNFGAGGIDGDAVVDKAVPIRCLVGRLDNLDDRQIELRGELEIARVVRRHGHDRAGAVAGENVVGNPDRNLLAVDGIDGVGAGEDAGFFLGQFGAFEVALLGDLGLVAPRLPARCAAVVMSSHQLVFGASTM